jgi:raffinose/stachyose/melibiose transport system permease protein
MILVFKNKFAPYLFVIPALVFILIFVYLPIIENFYFSFFRMNSYAPGQTFIGLDNFKDIFQNEIFYTAIINNTWYAVISLIFQVGLGLILAILLESKLLGKERKFFRTIYFIPSVIAIAAVGLMFYLALLFSSVGLYFATKLPDKRT